MQRIIKNVQRLIDARIVIKILNATTTKIENIVAMRAT